jgi:glycosyltransferase involved in cell wall biosynthesis
MLMCSDLVLSASTGEGSGLIMPESMACGKPIIHTAYSTAHEWLIDTRKGIGERGIVVPLIDKVVSSFNVEHGHVDTNKFIELALEYMDDPNLRKEHGINGRLFVERFANWDYLVESWKHEFFRNI